MEKSQTEIKEELRQKIKAKIDIINLKTFCERMNINYSNTRKFISGYLSSMSIEKAEKLLDYIEYVDKYDFTK
mgnify:FL=1